ALESADPQAKPVIDPRYLSDSAGADRAAILAGLRTCARIAEAPAMKAVLGDLIYPPNAPADLEAVLEHTLTNYAHTLYHPIGTCRMGTDPASVVDPDLRVRGVANLRVADASVMPVQVRGHTHAPSVFIGEQAARFLRSANGATRPAPTPVRPRRASGSAGFRTAGFQMAGMRSKPSGGVGCGPDRRTGRKSGSAASTSTLRAA